MIKQKEEKETITDDTEDKNYASTDTDASIYLTPDGFIKVWRISNKQKGTTTPTVVSNTMPTIMASILFFVSGILLWWDG